MQEREQKRITCGIRQAGLTITELLITISLGMTIVGTVLVGYLATYGSSMDTLASSKLNQDVSAVMGLMVSELRRHGYNGTALDTPTDNPFNQPDDTALEVFDNMTANVQLVPAGDGTWTNNFGGTPTATEGSCIVFAYDFDEDGVVDANELGGFRLNAGVVEMRTAGNVADPDTCASANNTWQPLTELDFITVTALTFNLDGAECLNNREPDNVNNDPGEDANIDEADEGDCYNTFPVAGNITTETNQISITLTANLTEDAFVRTSQSQHVRVRNDYVRTR